MTQLDLFSGIGGFSLAARWAGWQTPVMVEWNPYCQEVLKKNFPDATIFGDIRKFDGRPYAGKIDILTGGFPCQPYSHAGKRAGNNDDRALWPEMLRVIREVAPPWIVGENVAGLLSLDGGRVFAGILTDMENAGYCPEIYLIPAVGVGAPHERYRVWIVAHNTRLGRMRRADNKGLWPAGGIRVGGENQGTIADANMQRRREQHTPSEPGGPGFNSWGNHSDIWREHWYGVATRICGIHDGFPAGVDGTGNVPAKTKKGKAHRLEALGNAIVPQIALQIFNAINEYNQ